jgi:two-component system, sensor histidine kinase and response regulator
MAQGTILVVEDDPILLDGIRDILEFEQYNVLTALNGADALYILEDTSSPPDLVVSDIMMPCMNGLEFLKHVRQIDRYVSMPFIFLTARGEKTDIQEAKRLGVDDYVVKPFSADDVIVAIESCLARARDIRRIQTGREDELKRSILTILNHEFRTPLTFVVAYSDLLEDLSAEQENAEMLTFLQGVRSGANRLQRLVENFITLVELETGAATGNFEYRRQSIPDLKMLLAGAIERSTLLTSLQRTCTLTVESGLPPLVGDRNYLTTAVVHLIENACKFSDAGTPIEVRAARSDNYVVISVHDQGRGVPKDEFDNIWKTFYQVNRAHHEDQGAGSGLAIVKGVCQLHGGYVNVQSEVDVGSTFSICIPLTSEPALRQQQL